MNPKQTAISWGVINLVVWSLYFQKQMGWIWLLGSNFGKLALDYQFILKKIMWICLNPLMCPSFSSVAWVVSDSLQPHGLHYDRLPCPSPTTGVYPNSSPLSQWCHPTISSSVIPISSPLQSFPASESFPMSQFLHQVAKVLELQFQHQSFQWIFRLISFRIDWFDFLAVQFSSVQFSHSVVSNSSWPHESQHARPPCPSPTPGVYSNSSPLSQWCHPTISSSVIPFSSCLQSFPTSESFPMSQFFTSVGVWTSASVLPMNIQDWFPLGWTGWISLQSKGLSRVFSNTTVQSHQFFGTQLSL